MAELIINGYEVPDGCLMPYSKTKSDIHSSTSGRSTRQKAADRHNQGHYRRCGELHGIRQRSARYLHRGRLDHQAAGGHDNVQGV